MKVGSFEFLLVISDFDVEKLQRTHIEFSDFWMRKNNSTSLKGQNMQFLIQEFWFFIFRSNDERRTPKSTSTFFLLFGWLWILLCFALANRFLFIFEHILVFWNENICKLIWATESSKSFVCVCFSCRIGKYWSVYDMTIGKKFFFSLSPLFFIV